MAIDAAVVVRWEPLINYCVTLPVLTRQIAVLTTFQSGRPIENRAQEIGFVARVLGWEIVGLPTRLESFVDGNCSRDDIEEDEQQNTQIEQHD